MGKIKRYWWLPGFLILVALGLLYRWLAVDLPELEDVRLQTPSIRVLDRNGQLLYEVINEGRHSVVGIDQVPQTCIDATIATEDKNFYTNPGVSFRGMLRAIWQNLHGGEVVSGGSTITQQVARNHLLDPGEQEQRTVYRKLREIILAYRLTRHYSKDEILLLYVNQTYYGNLAYGIDAASRAYFDKPLADLSLAECALLAGLPQAPSLYDPLLDPQAAKERQLTVLSLMKRNGSISQSEFESASQQQLVYASERFSIEFPHAVFAAIAELETILPEEVIHSGGLEVVTTFDLNWIQTAERLGRTQLGYLEQRDIPARATGAALVAIDPHSGQVLALLGSPDYFNQEDSGAMNMALIPRQPGSTLKPFTYAALFDPSRPEPWTPATMILDVSTPFVTKEGHSYVPVNYDGREHGPVLVREALASSYNIPAVIALQELGPPVLFEFLNRLGITSLDDPANYDLALTLGGGEVSLLELTAAYAALANQGVTVTPYMIETIYDADGEMIYQAAPSEGERVIDRRVAWLITDILSDNDARAAGFGLHSVLQIGRPAAVKTGTTNDYRDNWTVGYTPDLVVGVWVGNTNNDPMLEVSGVSGAGPLWHQFMREILKGSPEQTFPQPPGIIQVEVCALSGLLPTADCPYAKPEWFIDGTQPTAPDNIYVQLNGQLYLNLPAQAHDWARQEGILLLPTNVEAPSDLVILSPDPETEFLINPTLPRDVQKLKLAASATDAVQAIKFYVDDELYLVDDAAPFEVWWPLEPGNHQLYVEADTIDGVVQSEPVLFFVRMP